MITINPQKLVRNANASGEFIFRGGLALQAELGAQNVRQFGRFLRTPRGARFIAQQALLQSRNPKRRKQIIRPASGSLGEFKTTTPDQQSRLYNPAAPLLAKGLSQEFTKLKPKRHIDLGRFGTPIESRTDNAVRFFDKNKGIGGSLQVRYGGHPGDLDRYPDRKGVLNDKPIDDFIKFRIRDAVNGKYIIFPALLSGITDNSSTSPTSFSYIGRADKVHVYGGYERTISFSVQIVAQRKEDVKLIWEKINYAKGLVLPQYKQFFSKDGAADNTRPVAPIVYLTLGDLYNNAPGFFTSVNLSIPENSQWELSDGMQVPHLCTLAFEFTYIGKENPTMTSNHFDRIMEKQPPMPAPEKPNVPPPPSEDDELEDDFVIEDDF